MHIYSIFIEISMLNRNEDAIFQNGIDEKVERNGLKERGVGKVER